MTDIVAEIEQDHVNMAKLLWALEYQVSVFERGERPDYDVIQGVVAYFLDYPDLCHHPKEDLVARRLMEKKPALAGALGGLAEQHEELSQLARRFAEVVRSVLDEAELSRDFFVRAASEFIESQRRHMAMEEEHFLPVAREALSEDDVAALGEAMVVREDPVFGAKTEDRYDSLKDAVLKWEREDEQLDRK